MLFLFLQVLMSGATECPTKPKGRPRKNSYYPHNQVPTNPLANLPKPTPSEQQTASQVLPLSQSAATGDQHHRFNSEDESMDHQSEHFSDGDASMCDSIGSPERPDSPQISVTD